MKPVIQEEKTGCGIAAVAVVAGTPYPQVKRAAHQLGISAQDKNLWSGTAHVRRLLKRFKISAGVQQPFRSWAALPNLALLAVKWHTEDGKPCWHWTVYVREKNQAYVLDSKQALRHHKRTDFGRIKPKWFIGLRK